MKDAPGQDRLIYANLLAVITDIRHKTGVGIKPMLSELADVLAEKIKAATPPSPVPDGWVMTPKDPTPEMKQAALAALSNATVEDPKASAWDALRAYRAMISAAPAAPAEASDE